MSLLGAALDGLRRWYVAVPPFLIIGLLTALFFLNSAGQNRLQEAGERAQLSAARSQSVADVEGAVHKLEREQQRLLRSGAAQDRSAYRDAAGEIKPRLTHLRLAYEGSESDLAGVNALQGLIQKSMQEFEASLPVRGEPGIAPPDSTATIANAIRALRSREASDRAAAAAHWDSSLNLSRWITVTVTLFNMLLVAIASRLVYMDMRRRSLQTSELRQQKLQLEHQVEERTRELVELSTHLQTVSEHEKEALARELHDELGGLLVGARMDVSWVEQRLSAADEAISQRLVRVQHSLAAGVDLGRRIIEELRPTLLDNVGLYAALRWQLKETCGRAGLACVENYPDDELALTSEASIALFRIAQEAFTNTLKHASAHAVDVSLEVNRDYIALRVADDGTGIPAERFKAIGSHGLAAMRHRVRALGGQFDVISPTWGGTVVTASIPLAQALAPVPLPEAV